MSLTELIEGVEAHEKTLRVFNADPEVVDTLRVQFGDRNLTVVGESTPSGQPSAFVVLSQDDEFVTAASVAEVLVDDAEADPGFSADSYRPILDHLDETLFTSYDTQQMISASREIEDRAWRLGKGELHAGFQKLSILAPQMDVYERLAEKEGLDVHAYAAPDADVPRHDTDMTIHVERSDEIRRSWFVVYDGGGVDVNKCALLAEERESRAFYGFWTYDPDTVDWLVDYLGKAYGLVEQ
ncbi:DICT sensory domain-containing protein [Halorarius litoreus]|uniref:DICT sensory domain-containing protein n=1 Tax=Halorarius litoreus TaxID=2962676 RepID=UPI0020CFCAAD|nr:DICT sensory domain-containing protein [Halorarius litoreus]